MINVFFLKTGVNAAVLSGTGNNAEVRDKVMKWEIGAEMTQWHHFRRGVGSGSRWQVDDLACKINSETEDGLVREKSDRDCPERLDLKLNFVASLKKHWWRASVFSSKYFMKESKIDLKLKHLELEVW